MYLLSRRPDDRSQTGRPFLRLCPALFQVRSEFKSIQKTCYDNCNEIFSLSYLESLLKQQYRF